MDKTVNDELFLHYPWKHLIPADSPFTNAYTNATTTKQAFFAGERSTRPDIAAGDSILGYARYTDVAVRVHTGTPVKLRCAHEVNGLSTAHIVDVLDKLRKKDTVAEFLAFVPFNASVLRALWKHGFVIQFVNDEEVVDTENSRKMTDQIIEVLVHMENAASERKDATQADLIYTQDADGVNTWINNCMPPGATNYRKPHDAPPAMDIRTARSDRAAGGVPTARDIRTASPSHNSDADPRLGSWAKMLGLLAEPKPKYRYTQTPDEWCLSPGSGNGCLLTGASDTLLDVAIVSFLEPTANPPSNGLPAACGEGSGGKKGPPYEQYTCYLRTAGYYTKTSPRALLALAGTLKKLHAKRTISALVAPQSNIWDLRASDDHISQLLLTPRALLTENASVLCRLPPEHWYQTAIYRKTQAGRVVLHVESKDLCLPTSDFRYHYIQYKHVHALSDFDTARLDSTSTPAEHRLSPLFADALGTGIPGAPRLRVLQSPVPYAPGDTLTANVIRDKGGGVVAIEIRNASINECFSTFMCDTLPLGAKKGDIVAFSQRTPGAFTLKIKRTAVWFSLKLEDAMYYMYHTPLHLNERDLRRFWVEQHQAYESIAHLRGTFVNFAEAPWCAHVKFDSPADPGMDIWINYAVHLPLINRRDIFAIARDELYAATCMLSMVAESTQYVHRCEYVAVVHSDGREILAQTRNGSSRIAFIHSVFTTSAVNVLHLRKRKKAPRADDVLHSLGQFSYEGNTFVFPKTGAHFHPEDLFVLASSPTPVYYENSLHRTGIKDLVPIDRGFVYRWQMRRVVDKAAILPIRNRLDGTFVLDDKGRCAPNTTHTLNTTDTLMYRTWKFHNYSNDYCKLEFTGRPTSKHYDMTAVPYDMMSAVPYKYLFDTPPCARSVSAFSTNPFMLNYLRARFDIWMYEQLPPFNNTPLPDENELKDLAVSTQNTVDRLSMQAHATQEDFAGGDILSASVKNAAGEMVAFLLLYNWDNTRLRDARVQTTKPFFAYELVLGWSAPVGCGTIAFDPKWQRSGYAVPSKQKCGQDLVHTICSAISTCTGKHCVARGTMLDRNISSCEFPSVYTQKTAKARFLAGAYTQQDNVITWPHFASAVEVFRVGRHSQDFNPRAVRGLSVFAKPRVPACLTQCTPGGSKQSSPGGGASGGGSQATPVEDGDADSAVRHWQALQDLLQS